MQDERVPQLNLEQRAIYDNVMAAISRPAFFVNGLGGISKTFFYSCLLSIVRAQGRVVVVVALFGIATLCWIEVALHTHVSRSLYKASTTSPHVTSVGTVN